VIAVSRRRFSAETSQNYSQSLQRAIVNSIIGAELDYAAPVTFSIPGQKNEVVSPAPYKASNVVRLEPTSAQDQQPVAQIPTSPTLATMLKSCFPRGFKNNPGNPHETPARIQTYSQPLKCAAAVAH